MAGQTNEGGERRRALDAERAGTGRRAPGHAAPVPAAPHPFASPGPSTGRDPFTTPATGTQAVWSSEAAPAPTSAPTPPLGTPVGAPEGAALPSRRDRAALRRPTVLDEAAVQASDSAAWRTSPALEDPRTASAISRPSPLTHALARTLTEHLDSLTPPAGLSPLPSGAARLPEAPQVYVPRRRPAPTISGPLPVVGATTTPAGSRPEPSWTTEPVASRREQRPTSASPYASSPYASSPFASSPFVSAPVGEPDLPPPPPAAEVEATLRERAARLSTAPVPPPMPDRVRADPFARTSYAVPGLPTTGLPIAAAPAASAPAAPATRPGASAPGAASVLTAADLAVIRSATAATAATTAAPAAGAAAPEAPAPAAEPRHGRSTGRQGRASGRAAGRQGRPAGRPDRDATTATTAARATSSRPGARPASRDRRWHQRRALGLPVGLLAAAVAMAAAVVVATWAGAPGHEQLTTALTAANAAVAPSEATPAAAAPAADPAASAAPEAAGKTAADGAGSGAAAAPSDGAGQASGAASQAAAPPASAAPSAPASPRTAPLGDVTYEVYGTAKTTYVELGTKDSREERQDLGSSYTKVMTGSKDWPGQYVAVMSFDGDGGGRVGCRIKDADGTVLAEEESTTPGQPATCIVGAPAGIN